MSQSLSSFDTRQADNLDRPDGSAGGRAGLYALIGGAALLLLGGGGAYYFLFSGPVASGPAPQAIAQPKAPAPAQVQPGGLQWTTIGTFGSWEARCANPPGGAARLCTAVLQVIDNRTKGVLMAWIVGPDDKGVMQSVFQTPTGVMLTSGVDVKLGNAAARKVNYQSCVSQQCTAVAPMSDAFLKEVLAVPKADVTLTAVNGQALNFGIPVTGLDKALAAIKK